MTVDSSCRITTDSSHSFAALRSRNSAAEAWTDESFHAPMPPDKNKPKKVALSLPLHRASATRPTRLSADVATDFRGAGSQ